MLWMRRFDRAPLAGTRLRWFGFKAEFAHGDLEVGPGFLFLAWIAQQVCRVIGDDKLATAPCVDATAEAGQGLALAEEIGGCRCAKRDDDLRTHNVNLAEEKRRAGIALVRLRRAVTRGTAFDDIGDVDLVATKTHGDDHVV